MTLTLYGMSASGNCWKPASLMDQLGIAYRWVEVDILKGESRTPAFLSRNPNGKVPLLQVAPNQYLAESNAMLVYLAEGSPLLPRERFARAKVMEWLFFEQYSHEPYIATVRFWVHLLGEAHARRDQIAQAMPRGYAALDVMETVLHKQPFLAGAAYTIADIALYAYTQVADQGGYELKTYPALRDWLQRVTAQPGLRPMAR